MTLKALIPARAGSKRLYNKNTLPVGGTPLLVRAIRLCQMVTDEVYVTTDSMEYAELARHHGALVLGRPPELANDTATVDDVMTAYLADPIFADHDVLMYQCSVVGVTVEDLQRLMTVGGLPYHSRTLVKPAHITWTPDSSWEGWQRKMNNRTHTELGVRFYPASTRRTGALPRTGAPQAICVVSPSAIDIDSPADYLAACAQASRRRIHIRFIYSSRVGSGHYRRALALAERLQHHDVALLQQDTADLIADIPETFRTTNGPPDLIINDCLDTSKNDMMTLMLTAPVITLEDLGSGALIAYAAVNDLYHTTTVNPYVGSKYAILRPEFLGRPPIPIDERDISILVSFGGTDPNHLTARVHDILGDAAKYVQPPGHPIYPFAGPAPSMSTLMANTKLLITSGGRTVYEAAALGTPAMVICQNIRETTHSHLALSQGTINLGLHNTVEPVKIKAALSYTDEDLQHLSDAAYDSIDGLGLERVLALIEQALLETR